MNTLESLYNDLIQEIQAFKDKEYLFCVYDEKITFYGMGSKAWTDFVVEREYSSVGGNSVEETNVLYYLSIFKALSTICYKSLRAPLKRKVVAYRVSPRYNIDTLSRIMYTDAEYNYLVDAIPIGFIKEYTPIVDTLKKLKKYIQRHNYYTSVTLSGEWKVKKLSYNTLLYNACSGISSVSFSKKPSEVGRYETLKELS